MGRASRNKNIKRFAKECEQLGITVVKGKISKKMIRSGVPQEQKLSNALVKIMNDMLPENSPMSRYKKALSVIAFGWNFSILPPDESERQRELILDDLAGSDLRLRADILRIFALVTEKKQQYFPDDKRIIAHCKIEKLGDGRIHVSAAELSPGALKNISE